MKVVFDTNVYVSALTVPRGSAAQALDRVVTGRHDLFCSKPILDELLGVLARTFARDREELSRVALLLSDLATVLRPRHRLRVVGDEADNRIVECGLAGRVDAIVTGDKGLLKLASYEVIRVISVRELLDS